MLCVWVCARNALDSVAGQHKLELQQARQQAVAEYRTQAMMSETADLSDASVLTDLHATNAVRSFIFCTLCLSESAASTVSLFVYI